MSNLIKYEPLTLEDMDRVNEQMTTGDGMTLEEGKNIIRAVPARAGERPIVVTAKHWIQVPGNTRKTVFICPRIVANLPCPACAHGENLNSSGSAADRDAAKEWWPRKNAVMNAVNRKRPDDGPRKLTLPNAVKDALDKFLRSNDPNFIGGDFTDPVNGYDIMIERKGKGLDTEYPRIVPARATSPLHTDPVVASAWIENQPDLRELLKPPTTAEIIRLLGIPGQASGKEAPQQVTGGKRAQDSIDAQFDDV